MQLPNYIQEYFEKQNIKVINNGTPILDNNFTEKPYDFHILSINIDYKTFKITVNTNFSNQNYKSVFLYNVASFFEKNSHRDLYTAYLFR